VKIRECKFLNQTISYWWSQHTISHTSSRTKVPTTLVASQFLIRLTIEIHRNKTNRCCLERGIPRTSAAYRIKTIETTHLTEIAARKGELAGPPPRTRSPHSCRRGPGRSAASKEVGGRRAASEDVEVSSAADEVLAGAPSTNYSPVPTDEPKDGNSPRSFERGRWA
jgi:hypothetical protein